MTGRRDMSPFGAETPNSARTSFLSPHLKPRTLAVNPNRPSSYSLRPATYMLIRPSSYTLHSGVQLLPF